MIGALLATAALAGPTPTVAVRADGAVDGARLARPRTGVGGAVTAGVQAWGPLFAEVDVSAGWRLEGGAGLDVVPQLRVFATPWRRDGPRVSFHGGPGLQVVGEGGLAFVGRLGGAFDAPVARDWALRAEGGWVPRLGHPGAAQVGLGVVWAPRKPPPPPVEEPEEVLPAQQEVWLPYPVCSWTDVDEARSRLAELEGEVASGEATGPGDAEALASPVVVVGLSGDRVILSGAEEVLRDGTASFADVPRAATLRFVGGGVVSSEVTRPTRAGHVTWIARPDRPRPDPVRFALGAATLDEAALAQVATLAADRGGWAYVLRGSYSAEGSLDANLALAARRAQAVLQGLRDAGVPADAVRVGEPVAPDPARSAEENRAVLVVAVAPGEDP